MIRRMTVIAAIVCLATVTVTSAWSHPPRRAHRHYGPHTHVYVQHQHYGSGLRGFRGTPYIRNFSFGIYSPYWYGYGPGWGFSSGAWINSYPWWGWSSGYYGYPAYTPYYYGASLGGGVEVPYIVGNGEGLEDDLADDAVQNPLTRIVGSNRARVTSKPESREWLPIAPAKGDVPEADAADTLRSLRYQTEGDILFRKQDYMNAYLMYSRAAVMDESRAEPRMRMGLALAATEQWDRSLKELRHALELNPKLARDSETLDSLFGENNESAKSEFIAGVRRWVERNVQDADRLFLLGVILHLDDQIQSAAPLFQQVAHLDDQDPYVKLFLSQEIDDVGLKMIGSRKSRLTTVPAPPPPGDDLPIVESAIGDAVKAVRPQPSRVAKPQRTFQKSPRTDLPAPPLPGEDLPAAADDDDTVEAARKIPATAPPPAKPQEGPQFPAGEEPSATSE